MNRLQKKCFIAATGMHLLLVVILIVGPAFLTPSSKPDDSKMLEVIPSILFDRNVSGGGGNPSPAPPPAQPAPQAPVQPAAKPVEQVKVSQPAPTKKVEPPPVKVTTPKSSEPTVQVKTERKLPTELVVRNPTDKKAAEIARAKADEANKRRAAELAELNKSVNSLRNGLNSKTDIKTSPGLGGSGEAYASYETAIRSIYDAAWIEPHNSTSEDATAEVTIVIARDGRVITARITKPSGDSFMDASIQRALDNVKSVPPFPPNSKDAQRSYIIPFNLKTKRLSA